jgi:nucleotide-binding universal stress UspA family protein
MTYKTLLVHLKLAHSNNDLLRIASDLADKFGARVVGIAACQPTPMVYSDGYSPGALIETDRTEIDRELKVAETEFRAAFQSKTTLIEWRSATIFECVADYVSRESASADLIITSGLSLDPDDTARPEKPGDIVMQAGRPVLVVPRTANTLKLARVVVAWKNTRESRRAVTDALPLLNHATSVTVLELAHKDEEARVTAQLTDLCAWLKTHGVTAEPKFVLSGKGDDAYQLDAAIEALGTDVVVAGAYGHSRLREWALGGVTRDLLFQANYCALLSH